MTHEYNALNAAEQEAMNMNAQLEELERRDNDAWITNPDQQLAAKTSRLNNPAHAQQEQRIPSTFRDIKAGDRVYNTKILPDGSTITHEGIASSYKIHFDEIENTIVASWYSENMYLISSLDELRDDVIIERVPAV